MINFVFLKRIPKAEQNKEKLKRITHQNIRSSFIILYTDKGGM